MQEMVPRAESALFKPLCDEIPYATKQGISGCLSGNKLGKTGDFRLLPGGTKRISWHQGGVAARA
jgi:hypothetical protein